MASTPKNSVPVVSRRDFARRAALASAAAVLAPACSTEPGGATAVALQAPAPAAPATQGDVRFATMWEAVLRKQGDRLSAEQKTRMQKIIANNVRMLKAIDTVQVGNGDTPASTLVLVAKRGQP